MKRSKSNDIPIWKQMLAVVIAAYCLAVWALPTFMLPFVNVLPYVHQMDFLHRLIISATLSLLVVSILYLLNPTHFLSFHQSGSSDSKWGGMKRWLGPLLGLIMFTFSGAYWSPNLFGVLTRAFPSSEYAKTVEIVNVDFLGTKHKSVSLMLKDKDGKAMYLVLAQRLFDYPRFKSGDTLELHGIENFVGAYVINFKVVGNRLTHHSSGTPNGAP
ncbi:MAG: hypothetical protein Q7V02_01035 [Methylophilus sp.]|nr:hypothetical protein [Methylophilus sp.]